MRAVGIFRQPWLWLSLLLRLALGGVWIYAGATKITDLPGSVDAVFAYRLLPESLGRVVGAALPFVEITLGALLIIGYAVRVAAVTSGALLIIFIIAVISAAARGLRIDCGCFGDGGDLNPDQSTKYTLEIVRDSALLLGSALLAAWPASRFAVDNYAQPSSAQDTS